MPEEHMQLEAASVVKVSIDSIRIVQLKNVYNVVNTVTKTIKKKKLKMFSTKMVKGKQLQLPPQKRNLTEYNKIKLLPMQSPKSIKVSIVKVNYESVSPSIRNFRMPAKTYNAWKSTISRRRLDGLLRIVLTSLKSLN